MSATLLGQSILAGLFSGGLYGLLGLGLTLSWKFLRIINIAHFACVFLSAYLTYELVGVHGLHFLLAILLLAPLFFLFGVVQQLVMMRFKVDEFASVIVTFGLTIIIEAVIQQIWSADFRRLETSFLRRSLEVGPFFVPMAEALLLVTTFALCLATWAYLKLTFVGKALRAGVEDPLIAAAFGVDSRRLALLLAGASGACAAIAGAFVALIFTLAPSQIFTLLGVVLATVILGGLGNPIGVLAGGILIGVSEAITMVFISPSWAPVVSFTLLILILIFWPERI